MAGSIPSCKAPISLATAIGSNSPDVYKRLNIPLAYCEP